MKKKKVPLGPFDHSGGEQETTFYLRVALVLYWTTALKKRGLWSNLTPPTSSLWGSINVTLKCNTVKDLLWPTECTKSRIHITESKHMVLPSRNDGN